MLFAQCVVTATMLCGFGAQYAAGVFYIIEPRAVAVPVQLGMGRAEMSLMSCM